jgi:hypothetical protein
MNFEFSGGSDQVRKTLPPGFGQLLLFLEFFSIGAQIERREMKVDPGAVSLNISNLDGLLGPRKRARTTTCGRSSWLG